MWILEYCRHATAFVTAFLSNNADLFQAATEDIAWELREYPQLFALRNTMLKFLSAK